MTTKNETAKESQEDQQEFNFTPEQQAELDFWRVPVKLYRYYGTTWHGLTEQGLTVDNIKATRTVNIRFSAKILGQTVDRLGYSWVEALESPESQIEKWGVQKLGEGPAPKDMKDFITGSTLWAIKKKSALDGLRVYPEGTKERRQQAALIQDYFGGPDPRNTKGVTISYDRWVPEGGAL